MLDRSKCLVIALLFGLYSALAQAAAPSTNESHERKSSILEAMRAVPDVPIEPSRRMRARGFRWDHEIQVALPPSYYKSTKSYPVLWVTDGSWMFNEAVAIVNLYERENLPEMIVVAVGSPPEVSQDEIAERRLYDFTPSSKGPEFDGFGSELVQRKSETARKQRGERVPGTKYGFGGGPEFLSFVVDTVRPLLARDYRMSNEHILFGDSGGGVFCTYALLARPQAFGKYICGSPALNWGSHELFVMEEHYAQKHKDLPATVFFGAGEAELLENHPLGIVSSMARMVEILRAREYPSLKLYARTFPGESHGSVIPLNLRWGLKAVLH